MIHVTKSISGSVIQHSAYEWVGKTEEERAVVVKIKPQCEIEVTSSTGTRLRVVTLKNQSDIDVVTATNKGRTLLLLKVPKEYDLVIMRNYFPKRTSGHRFILCLNYMMFPLVIIPRRF